MDKTFPENIKDIRTAVMASEVREGIAQGMEYVEQFASTATTKAAEAAASAAAAAKSAENASTAVSAAIDPTLSVSGKAADAAKVGEVVGKVKEDVATQKKQMPYKDAGKIESVTKSGIAFLSEDAPVNIDITGAFKKICGKNRFDIDNQELSFNSYSSAHTVVKQNGGYKIQCNVTSETSNVYASTNITADFSGHMVVSCDANCTGDVKDLRFAIKVNNVSLADTCAGRGHYLLGFDVDAGDDITLMFYTSNANANADTLMYYNILVAYNGFYDYCPYTTDLEPSRVKKTYTVPADSSVMENHSITGGYYVTIAKAITDMYDYPKDTYTEASISVSGGTVCAISGDKGIIKKSSGVWVGVYPNGTVALNVDSKGRSDVAAYLKNNPITIMYQAAEIDEASYAKIKNHVYQMGEIVVLDNGATINYNVAKKADQKRLVCFGDSITGMFGSDSSYPDMISRMSNIDAINVGFAGCCMADHSNNKYVPFCMSRLADAIVSGDYTTQDAQADGIGGYYPLHVSQLKEIDWKTVDYISIFYGTNDWGMNKIMLSTGETDRSTCTQDALKYSIETILQKYPWIKILIIAPYWRSKSNGLDSNKDANDNGDYLFQFSDMIVATAKDYNLPSLNLYYNIGANIYTNRYFTKDGTHPTEMCKEIIAKKIIDCIECY